MAFLLIVIICYCVVALVRKTPLANECLPIISGGLGLLLGLIAFYTLPSIVPSESAGITAAYGFFCGLAATGSNQVFKQTLKYIVNKYDIVLPLFEDEDDEKRQ